jgi:deoxyribodipyrimidine photolyase-related protein
MKTLILFPHHLFETILDQFSAQDTQIIIHEHPLFFTAYKFHKTKLWFHRATMQIMKAELESRGYSVQYFDYTQSLDQVCSKISGPVEIFDPVDTWLARNIADVVSKYSLAVTYHDNPSFYLTHQECLDYSDGKKHARMQYFYEFMRKKTGYLMQDGKPIGDAYSFDTENRKPYKNEVPLPEKLVDDSDDLQSRSAHAWVTKNFPDNPGEICQQYPISWNSARTRADQFIAQRLAYFGPYEDAMIAGESELFHSSLSMFYNCGILSPKYCVDQAVAAYDNNQAQLPSVEGFVRQVIGWREYMRLLYVVHGTTMRSAMNRVVGRRAHLSPAWYGVGKTGCDPLDDVLSKLFQNAYSHHIERLMVVGNMMQLFDINIHEVYTWFMMHYIDAYDWVMLGNIVAMSQYVSTQFTTKPYISGSRYIRSMSNYPSGPWTDIWDALYWEYINIHQDEFSKNPRMSMMVRMYQKMSLDKKQIHTDTALRARHELTAKKPWIDFELDYKSAISSS